MEPIKDDGRPVALVTGGTSGIGKATARMLAAQGWRVIAVGLNADGSVPETQRLGRGELFTYEMDVTKPSDITRILGALPRLDAIVHCAGFGIAGSAECTPMTLARKQFDVNYFGVLQVNEIALPLLRRTAARNRKRGRVIVVGSIGGRLGLPFQSHYSSTKAALEMYVEALRLEGRRHGITATIIEPGDLSTGFTVSSPNQPIHRTTTNANVQSGKRLMTSRPVTVRKAWPESSSRRSANAILRCASPSAAATRP